MRNVFCECNFWLCLLVLSSWQEIKSKYAFSVTTDYYSYSDSEKTRLWTNLRKRAMTLCVLCSRRRDRHLNENLLARKSLSLPWQGVEPELLSGLQCSAASLSDQDNNQSNLTSGLGQPLLWSHIDWFTEHLLKNIFCCRLCQTAQHTRCLNSDSNNHGASKLKGDDRE